MINKIEEDEKSKEKYKEEYIEKIKNSIDINKKVNSKISKITKEDIVMKMCENNNYIISILEVEEFGISSKYISNLVKKGFLRKITKGIYVDSVNFKDEYYEKQARARKSVYSHESALYLLGVISNEPKLHKLTIPSHYNTRIITNKEIEFYYLKKDIYEVGINTIRSKEDNLIKVYDEHRSICEIIKDKKRISDEELNYYIAVYLNYENKDINKVLEYATILNCKDEVSKYLK